MNRSFLLKCAPKNYDWGKLGSDSSVAMFLQSAWKDFKLQNDLPYAELWMGTHPSGPSVVPSMENASLSEIVTLNPALLGSNILDNFKSPGLPFLFKVLSIRKALSIQAHPNKETAERLHRDFKQHYPDNNHKPEMAIALTEFKALCGFRPLMEIKSFIAELPQLRQVIGENIATKFVNSVTDDDKLVKPVFVALMTAKPETFQPLLDSLVEFMKKDCSISDLCKSVKDIFLEIHSQYPKDVGCFCVFFLNYIVLKPGEALFLAANVPHAYLKGDCIECMATSDNVVRAGLTPKFRDVDTLCEILAYDCKPAVKNLFTPTVSEQDPFVKIYNPPVPDFAVDRIAISSNSTYNLKVLKSASLLIVIEGVTNVENDKPFQLSKGQVLFIGAHVELKFHSLSELLMFRAYCDL